MTGDHASPGDPEPIEAEFEPAVEPGSEQAKRDKDAKKRMRSGGNKSIGWTEFGLGLAVATLASVGISTVLAKTGAGGDTGTLAREIDGLTGQQETLLARADQVSSDIVALRAQADNQRDQIGERLSAEQALRRDLDGARSQLSALLGGGDADTAGNADPNSPLGRLMTRIRTVEEAMADEASAPQTTRQMQRSLRNLTERVEVLDDANVELATAVERRRAAMAALEDGLERLNKELADVREGLVDVDDVETEIGAVRQSVTDMQTAAAADRAPIMAAAEESRTIRAIATLETAAQKGGPFLNQHRALAAMLPDNPEVIAMRDIARRGAPTMEQLRSDFRTSAGRAEASAAEKVDDGWNWLRGAMNGVVTVRRTDADRVTLQHISSARSAMEASDIRGAIDAVSELQGEPASAFRAWREAAVRRADLEDHLESLNARLLKASEPENEG